MPTDKNKFVETIDELACPYCHGIQGAHEPDAVTAVTKKAKCEKCGKDFYYAVIVRREYTSIKAAD